jgi:tripartite-type tricarboxylate transporter receptor subunit TctC
LHRAGTISTSSQRKDSAAYFADEQLQELMLEALERREAAPQATSGAGPAPNDVEIDQRIGRQDMARYERMMKEEPGLRSIDALPFDFLRDIAPVGGLVAVPQVMEVHPSVPAKNVAEFIAYAKVNPGKINMASVGVGSTPHLAGELFKVMTGVNMVHVPYRGSAPALTDLLGGQVQVMFDALPSSLTHIQSGALRAMAVTTAARSAVLPDLPTVGETVPGYATSTWYGVGVPKATPSQIIDQLNREITAGLVNQSIKTRFVEAAMAPMPLTRVQFGKLIAEETERWGKVVKFAGIKAE